jgi:hypothetical protein
MPRASSGDPSLVKRRAAHISWANTPDPSARTAPARAAFDARFEREVDPDGVLPPAERKRRAAHARKAFFLDLAARSARSRRKKPGKPGTRNGDAPTARSAAAEPSSPQPATNRSQGRHSAPRTEPGG